MRVRRGDLFRAGGRPHLVVSRDAFNDRTGTAIALPVARTPQNAGFPLSSTLVTGRLPKRSWVKIGQVRTVSTLRFGRRLGRVDAVEVDRIVEGLFDIVGP